MIFVFKCDVMMMMIVDDELAGVVYRQTDRLAIPAVMSCRAQALRTSDPQKAILEIRLAAMLKMNGTQPF